MASYRKIVVPTDHPAPLSPPESDDEVDLTPPPPMDDDFLPPPPGDDDDDLPPPETPEDLDEPDTPCSPPPTFSSRFVRKWQRTESNDVDDDIPSPPDSPPKGKNISTKMLNKPYDEGQRPVRLSDGDGVTSPLPPDDDMTIPNIESVDEEDLPPPSDSDEELNHALIKPEYDRKFETPQPSPQPQQKDDVKLHVQATMQNTRSPVVSNEEKTSPLLSSNETTLSNSKSPHSGSLPRRRHSGVDRLHSASTDSNPRRSGRIRHSVVRGQNPAWITSRQWKLGQKIGSGSFGGVFQGMNDKGCLFAVKRMNVVDKPNYVKDLLMEIQLMRGLSHPHIVEYIGAFVDQDEGALFIFQEWAPGGSVAFLLQKFGPFTVGVVQEYTKQILQGLNYLHSNGIVHRDIKGGNILIGESGLVKLADFGASTELSQFEQTQETSTIRGTPYFMAPEVLASSRYGRKGDVWAVGCTMIQMLTGQPPWKDRDIRGLVQLHLLLSSREEGPPPYDCEITPECRVCLEMCFRNDASNRPTVAELQECDFLREEDEIEIDNHEVAGSADTEQSRSVLTLGKKSASFMLEQDEDSEDVVNSDSIGASQDELGESLVIQKLEEDMAAVLSKSRANSLAIGDRVSEGSPVILDDTRRKQALQLLKPLEPTIPSDASNAAPVQRFAPRPDNPFSSVRRTKSSGV